MAFLAVLLLCVLQEPKDATLAQALAEAVDQPTPALRLQRAKALAQGHTLDELLPVLQGFGTFEPAAPGLLAERHELRVGDEREDTELCVWVPPGYDPERPAPLIVAFHGTGGSGRGVFPMWQETAASLGALVLAPSEAGANDGYQFSERERDAALAAIRWARRRFNVDEDRIVATGVSRGGHLAWDLALRHPDLFCAIAPMIGSPRITLTQGQNNFRYLENIAQLSIRDLQGAQDDPAMVFSVRLAFEHLRNYAARDAELLEFPELAHSFEFPAVDWNAFLGSARRDPRPDGIVRRSARVDEGRAFWVEITRLGKDVAESFTPRIRASEWNKLDLEGQRKKLVAEALERTARLEVRMLAPGRFEARSEGVERFRLLLTQDMLDPRGMLTVSFRGKTHEPHPRPDPVVLLTDFVERFDRRFLPVAQVEVR